MIRRSVSIMAIFVCIFALALPALAQDTISVGDTVEGTATANVEYSISLDAGASISIALNSDDFDAFLRLLDSSGTELAYDDDSGGSLNALLVFTAPESGTYTIVVTSWMGAPDGAYTLIVSGADITVLGYEESVSVELTGGTPALLSFEGTAGEVINLTAEAEDADTVLEVSAPDGTSAYDDDSGGNLNPAILRYTLPATGTYQVTLRMYGDGDDTIVKATVLLEATESIILGTEPISLVLGGTGGNNREVLSFDAEPGMLYTVTVASVDGAKFSPSINISSSWSYISASGGEISSLSFSFDFEEAGAAQFEITNYTWGDDDVELTISMEVVEMPVES